MFINWYKLAQLSDVEVIEEPPMSYLHIGHEGEGGYKYVEDSPNHIWAFHDGEVLSVEEGSEHAGHSIETFPGINFETSFTGRFESSTGRLSVHRPYHSISRYRSVPKSILFKLYQKFPGVKQVYVY